jgi:hypothetical protein
MKRGLPAPTADAVAEHLRERGYAAVEGALSSASCMRLRAECERVVAALREEASGAVVPGELPSPASGARLHAWDLPSGEAYLFKVKPIADLSPAIGGLADHPLLRAVLGQLLRGEPRRIEDKLMLKQRVPGWPGRGRPVLGAEVHRHTDSVYFVKRGFSADVVSSAFALDDCTPESGPLRVWPGTHRGSMPVEDGGPHGPVVPAWAAPDAIAIDLTVPAGSLLFWHSRLVHASSANVSARPRRLVVFGHDHG